MPAGENTANTNLRVFGAERPVAFITGSLSPRVGRVIAEHLSAAGFRIVLHGTSAGPEDNVASTLADLVLSGYVQDEAQVSQWLDSIVDRFGRVDVLVNSAAIWEPKPLEDTVAQDFEQFFRVNCLGSSLTCKHFGLQMCRQENGGSIINIGDWAIARPYRDFSAYFPSKGAIPVLTQGMAVELAERNPRVRVNAILPGPVLLAEGISDMKRQKIIDECLLRREGTADDVAEAALYLARAPFLTGVCIPVDGGRSIYSGSSADAIAHPDHSDS